MPTPTEKDECRPFRLSQCLSLSFDGALMESTDEELVITVLPADAGE